MGYKAVVYFQFQPILRVTVYTVFSCYSMNIAYIYDNIPGFFLKFPIYLATLLINLIGKVLTLVNPQSLL